MRDRANSAKFSTPRVSKQYAMLTFGKLFKNGGHFEFSYFLLKLAKHKIASISLTVRDRVISSKFSTPRVSKQYAKWWTFWIFNFLPKVAKHKIASITLTVRDRAISSKFSSPRISKHYTISTFWKVFKKSVHFELSSSKMPKEIFLRRKILSSIALLLCYNISIPGDTSRCAADF